MKSFGYTSPEIASVTKHKHKQDFSDSLFDYTNKDKQQDKKQNKNQVNYDSERSDMSDFKNPHLPKKKI